jgi:flagellar motor switch protein FliG
LSATEEIAPSKPLSGSEKAAILLVTLGEQASASLIKQLSDQDLRTVTRSIANLQLVAPEQAERVLEEFYQFTVSREYPHRGGAEYAKRVLTNAFGRDGMGRLAGELELDSGGRTDAAEPLRQTDPAQLAKLIKSEHPQTIAIVLAHLSHSQAASVLSNLPQDLRADIVMRMAALDQISPDVIRKITGISRRGALGGRDPEPG